MRKVKSSVLELCKVKKQLSLPKMDYIVGTIKTTRSQNSKAMFNR